MKFYLKTGVFFAIIIGIMLFTGIDFAYATEPRISFIHGEFMDSDEIYPTEWIGVIFSEPLKNNSGQATKAIQKAVNKSFGSGIAVVETEDNTSFVINIKSKIKLNENTIKLPLRSIQVAASSDYNFAEMVIQVTNGDQVMAETVTIEDISTTTNSPIPPTANITAVSATASGPAAMAGSGDTYPGQLFYNASKGDNVRKIQGKLREKGHDAGAEDGIFGRITTKAVKSFQKAQNLDVDGIVGPITWPALFGLGIIYKKRKKVE